MPTFDTTLTAGSSSMNMQLVQTASGNYILGIYLIVPGGSYTRVAATASTAVPAAAGWLGATALSTVDVPLLTGGLQYLACIFFSANAPSFTGISTVSNTNFKPYTGMTQANLGTISAAPATILESSTSEANRIYLRILT